MDLGEAEADAGGGSPEPAEGTVEGARSRTVALFAALALILGTVGMATRTGGGHARAAEGAQVRRPDVILVAVDGLSSADVSADAAPFLHQLGANTVTYRDAYAPSPWASETLRGILSGRYLPVASGAEGWTPGLADELGHRGYRTVLVPGHERHALGAVEGDSLEARAPAGFQEVLWPDGVHDPAGAQGADVVKTALRWWGAAEGPSLMVVTLADPRAPHHHYRGGRIGPDPDYVGPVRSGMDHEELLRLGPSLDAADRAQLTALHATEVGAADAAIQTLLAGAERRRGRAPIVVVVGLRQSPLGEEGRFGLVPSLEPEDLRSPLWLQLPSPTEGHAHGVLRGVVRAPVSLLDLEPTLLDALGVPPRLDLDGRSVYPGAVVPERPIRAFTSRGICAVLGLDGDRAVILEAEPPAAHVRTRGQQSNPARAGRWSPCSEVTGVDADLRLQLARWMKEAEVRVPGGEVPDLVDAPFSP